MNFLFFTKISGTENSHRRIFHSCAPLLFYDLHPGNFFHYNTEKKFSKLFRKFFRDKDFYFYSITFFRNFLFSVQIHPFLPFRAASAVTPQARTALKQLASRIIIVFMLIHFDHVLNFAVVPDSASLRTPELTGSTALLHFSSCSGGNRERCCCHKILQIGRAHV